MQLTAHSRNKLLKTFETWRVDKDFAEPMYNYLVHGFEPGSCFTSVLANDFYSAIVRSHPANTVEAFKSLAKWIYDIVPAEARGSYDAVKIWSNLDESVRRSKLEEKRVIYTAEEETWLILKNEPTQEPIIW